MPKVQNGLYKNEGGRVWHYHFKFRGLVYKGSTGCESKTLAKDWLHQYRERLAGQEMGLEPKDVPTLRAVVKAWEDANTGAYTQKHLTVTVDKIRLNAGKLLDLPISELSTERVDSMRSEYLRNTGPTGRTHTAGGANSLMKALHGVMEWARNRGYIDALPYRLPRLQEKKRPRAVVHAPNVGAFLSAVDRVTREHPIRTAIRLMIGLGLREKEALDARWEWIRADGVYQPGDTKTGKVREVPVPAWLMAWLQRLPGSNTLGLIIPAEDGQPHRAQYTRKAIERAGELCGIHGLTPHRIRATFATLHANAGTPLHRIKTMLGHSSIETTMIYIESAGNEYHSDQERVAALSGLAVPMELPSTKNDGSK